MNYFNSLLNEGLECYESFYSKLFQQLVQFHVQNIEISSKFYYEQLKNYSLLSQLSFYQQKYENLQHIVSSLTLQLQEMKYQYDNLQDLLIGNNSNQVMNMLLDEVHELKEIKQQNELEIWTLKEKNEEMGRKIQELERKEIFQEQIIQELKKESQRIQEKSYSDEYQQFLRIYQLIQECQQQPEAVAQKAEDFNKKNSFSLINISPSSTTTPLSLVLEYSDDPGTGGTSIDIATSLSLPGIFPFSSSTLVQQIYHQIVNFPLNGILFESFIALLFQYHGYRAVLRSHSHDHGIDIDLYYKDPNRTWKGVVQCKQYTYKIGSSLIREFIGSMLNDHDGCHIGYLVTTSSFTREAYKTAEIWKNKGNNLELWDGKILMEKITPYAEELMKGIEEMKRMERVMILPAVEEMNRVRSNDQYLQFENIQQEGIINDEKRYDEKICFTRGDCGDRALSILKDEEGEREEGEGERGEGNEDDNDNHVDDIFTKRFGHLSIKSSLNTSSVDIDENNHHFVNSTTSTMTTTMTTSTSSTLLSSSSPSPFPSPLCSTPKSPSSSGKIPLLISPKRPLSPKQSRIPPMGSSSSGSGTPYGDKGVCWNIEETQALSQLVARFSQNSSARQTINWGQMEAWLKLPEGRNDPVGRLIQEEHKDKEKLRSKWKNEGRVKTTTTTTTSATMINLSPKNQRRL